MTTLSSLSSLDTVARLSTDTSVVSRAAAQLDTAQASTSVTLGQANDALQTYSVRGTASTVSTVWESASADDTSKLLAANSRASSLSSRFAGLGAALLNGLANGGGAYSQSVLQTSTTGLSDEVAAAATAIRQTAFHTKADNEITLSIKTARGVQVTVTLGSQQNGLGASIKVADGATLNDAERKALGALADSFQDAVDGLAAVPPKLALGGLTQFDSSVLSSVDLQAGVQVSGGVQTLSFHADSKGRSLAFDGPQGTVKVDVDLSDARVFGSDDQRAAAVDNYLSQIDSAGRRGRADTDLVGLFKDAFAQMNSHYGDAILPDPVDRRRIALNDTDHKLTSGLADFTASVKQTATSPNPLLPDEQDTFSYQANQRTEIRGTSMRDRSISQQQYSHLTASYHQQISPDIPMNLTLDPNTQNYYYTQINDSASAQVDLGYSDGKLVHATAQRSASQSTHTQKFIGGKVEQDTTTPDSTTQVENLLDTLKQDPSDESDPSDFDLARWQQALTALRQRLLLQDSPSTLRDQGRGHSKTSQE
ncbi:hypothetical protein [Bordetella sp. N]|uniref:hypothetical protein n=1 Tax=Bordetella sp. N TaxID=1746199 RepID=UPI00070DDE5C|nr:hypothetical protein [Bordetella sp. N]ALM86405.1 hypothetical protein ASB57_28840 [Bordetella sp. N]